MIHGSGVQSVGDVGRMVGVARRSSSRHRSAAAWYVARAALRRNWRGALALAVLLGALWGLALGVTIGARRTASAYPRMTRATKAVDIEVLPQLASGVTRLDPDAIRRLPGVDDFDVLDGYDTVVNDAELTSANAAATYTSRYGAVPDRFERLALTSGRRPRQDRIDEAVVTPKFVERYGLKTGDRFTVTIMDPRTLGLGGREPMRIVGVGRMSDMVVKAEGLSVPTIIATSSFYKHFARFHAYEGELLRVKPGTDLEALKRRINALAPAENIVFGTHAQRLGDVQRAIFPQIAALLVFATVLSLATLFGATQLIGQLLRVRARRQRAAMTGLGATESERAAGLRLSVLPPILLAAIVAIVSAVLLSPRFPVGVTRPIEVHPGTHVHWAGMIAGIVAPLVLLFIAVELTTRRATSEAGRASRRLRLGVFRSRSWPYGQARGWSLRSGRMLAGAASASAFAVAALVVAAGMHSLVSTPSRFGWRWDVSLYAVPDLPIPDARDAVASRRYEAAAEAMLAKLESATGLSGASVSRFGQVPVGAHKVLVPLIGFRRLHGDAIPAVLSGRLPERTGEIALGALVARSLHVGLGDTIDVGDGSAATSLRVVGTVAVPSLGFYPGSDAPRVGAVALVNLEQFAALQPPGSDLHALVRFDRSVPHGQRHALIEKTLGVKEDGERLAIDDRVLRNVDVLALGAAQQTPLLLVGVMTFLALVLLVQALVSEVRRRRGELAVLSVLGAAPATLRRLVSSYAMIVVGVASVVGCVFGVVLGRLVWGGVTSSMGVAPGHVLPLRRLLIAVGGALALGWAAAWWPSRSVRRGRPAEVLRAE